VCVSESLLLCTYLSYIRLFFDATIIMVNKDFHKDVLNSATSPSAIRAEPDRRMPENLAFCDTKSTINHLFCFNWNSELTL